MNVGDTIKVTNLNNQVFDAILVELPYERDVSHLYGNKKGEITYTAIKVRRFIKSKGEFAKTATEYHASSVVS